MKANGTSILEVINLSNHYEGKPLLQDISFTLEQGEILCLLGPSGSGKTTLLRLLAGLEKIDSGKIFFRDKDIRDTPPHRRNFGMMFQEYALFPHKSVKQNIAFGLEMQQCPAAEKSRKVQTVLDMVGMAELSHRRIDELSGGERQRVALARSLAPEPQLLLLDEPLGSLDRTLRDRLTIEIRTILKNLKMTAIFVTHDQAEAFSVADKVAVLHNGLLQQFDTPENLYRRPANTTVARFLGFTNFIEGQLDKEGFFRSRQGNLPMIQSTERGKRNVSLLIRPEGAVLNRKTAETATLPILSGIVTDRVFQGSTYRVNLQTDHGHLSFDLPIDPPPPLAGTPIELVLNPGAMVLIDQP